MLKYQRWHDDIIVRAQTRGTPVGYSELHHIVPKCVGGKDRASNLVRLVYKEHFVVHLLLVKMYEGEARRSLQFAVLRMVINSGQHDRRVTTGQREMARRAIQTARRGQPLLEETKIKLRQTMLGRKSSAETRALLSLQRMGNKHTFGRPLTEDHKRNISESLRGKPKTKEHSRKVGAALKGRALTEEHREKLREAKRRTRT